MDKSHVYIMIRKDLPFAQQIVQAAHATHEAGKKLMNKGISSIVLLEAEDETHLLTAYRHCLQQGIDTSLFYEPDEHLGYPPGHTALATEPLCTNKRQLMRQFKLYRKG